MYFLAGETIFSTWFIGIQRLTVTTRESTKPTREITSDSSINNGKIQPHQRFSWGSICSRNQKLWVGMDVKVKLIGHERNEAKSTNCIR